MRLRQGSDGRRPDPTEEVLYAVSKEKYIEDLKIILTKLRGDELLNPKILFGFISKISVRTRPIGNSRKDKDIRIFIEYKKINGLNEKCTILQQ